MKKTKIQIALIILLVFTFLSLVNRIPLGGSITEDFQIIPSIDSKGDLLIDFELNQTSIGKEEGALATLNIHNNGSNPTSDIVVDFSLNSEYTMLTPLYSSHQEITYLGSGASTSLNIEVQMNKTALEEESAADVVLVFDSSGSMSNEIEQVRSEFLAMTDRLVETIPDLRMGMIVYGWTKYSEYPASSRHNYVELTTDVNKIYDLLEELYANGGAEPWGDAFAVIDGWDWRPDIPKLAILVGDEDCDPGKIIGTSSTDSYYNGSQLLEVITSLKEKGVKICAVQTEFDATLEMQLNWITRYTGGEHVFLDEIESGEDSITLPEQIEKWTLALVREYFVDLFAQITWTEIYSGGSIDHETEKSVQIIIDLAPPSITVSTLVNQVSDLYDLEIYVKPVDVSGIELVNLYWTEDDLETDPTPLWHIKPINTLIDKIYAIKLSDFTLGDKLSFYIEASDCLLNTAYSLIYNQTIEITPFSFGSLAEFLFLENSSKRTFYFDFKEESETFNSGYLWIEAKQEIIVTFENTLSVETSLLYQNTNDTIFLLKKNDEIDSFKVEIAGNISNYRLKIKWTYNIPLTEYDIKNQRFQFDEIQRTQLYQLAINSLSDGYITLIPYSTELVFRAHIFYENWTKIATVGPYDPIQLDKGHYFIWVEQIVRTGSYGIYFGEPIYNGDPYYSAYVSGKYGIEIPIIIITFNIIALLGAYSKRLKNKRK